MKRILIINIARMGDMIQTSPLVTSLKEESDSGAEITMLVSEAFVEAASAIRGIDYLIPLPFKAIVEPLITPEGGMNGSFAILRKLADGLRDQQYDLVLNITHTHFSSVIASLVEGKESVGLNLDEEGFRIVKGAWANYYFNSCLNRNFNRFNLVDLHCKVGGVKSTGHLEFVLRDEARANAGNFLESQKLVNKSLIGVIPAASTPEKAYPVEAFAKVVAMIKERVCITPVIFGAVGDADLGEKFCQLTPGTVNLMGKTDVHTLAAMLEKCELVLTNDTGPMHVATAVGTRVIDISLGSALSHETAPYGEGHIVIEPRLSCYPCHPKMRCSHMSCHNEVSLESVANLSVLAIEDRVPDRLDDESLFNAVNVYRTGFDPDGWWELKPLIKRPLTSVDLYNRALREMWKRALDGCLVWTDEMTEYAGKIGAQYNDLYDVRSVESQSVEFARGFERIVKLSAMGRETALQLAEVTTEMISDKVQRINRLGERLREIDLDLFRLGYSHPELMPLVAQFTYGKDNLSGWALDILAKETARLYSELHGWNGMLKMWIENITQSIKRVSTCETAA